MLIAVFAARGQDRPKIVMLGEPDDSILRNLPNWQFTTKAYQLEALRLLVDEANSVAKELNLKEQLPITKTNLIEIFISPPGLGMVGTISTSNYAYAIATHKRFSNLTQRNSVSNFYAAKEKYTWPVSRIDTNLAFQIATQMLAAVKMNVAALNQNCVVEVTTAKLEETHDHLFVPDYWVTWRKSGEVKAFVEFVEPTRTIRQLDVSDPQYILREPIRVPNLAQLLNQTNSMPPTNPPVLTNAPATQ